MPVLVAAVQLQASPTLLKSSLTCILNVNTTYRLCHYHLLSLSAMALAVALSLTLSVISHGTVCHTITYPLRHQPWHCVTLSLTLSVNSRGTVCHTITYPLRHQPWHCLSCYHLPSPSTAVTLSHYHLPSPSSAMALSVTLSSPSCAHLPTPISSVRLMNSSMTFLQMSRLTELVTSTSTLCVSLEIWTQKKSQILILCDKL